MNGIDWRGAAVALAAGFGGALVAAFLGLPAAALLGSTLAVTLAGFAGLRPSVSPLLRDVAFCVLGVSLGSGVTPHIWSDIARWPLSIALLALTVLTVLFACGFVLKILFRTDMGTALLATSPGALSYTLSLAADRNADISFVIVMQSFRLFLITMFLPPLIGYAESGAAADMPAAVDHLTYAELGSLVAATFALGWIMNRLRMPAPYILAGLFVSGIAHGGGFVSGRLVDIVTFFAFAVTGAVIGVRFGGIALSKLRGLALAGIVSTVIAVSIAMAGAWLVSVLLDLPFGQVWVSFAPGGVEGMSSMALALGYDPVYVATHHVFRILMLIAVLPMLMGLFRSPASTAVPRKTDADGS